MTKEEQIHISLSKPKMILGALCAVFLVGQGLWLLVNPPLTKFFGLIRNPTVITIIGLVTVIFFGLVLVVIMRRLLNNKPGITINNHGIIYNAGGTSFGLIPWTDILELKTTKITFQKFLIIIVKNPQDYIDKSSTSFVRKGMTANKKKYGSPIIIAANGLQISFKDLHTLLLKKLNEFTT